MIPIHALLFSKHLFINTPKKIIEPLFIKRERPFSFLYKIVETSSFYFTRSKKCISIQKIRIVFENLENFSS